MKNSGLGDADWQTGVAIVLVKVCTISVHIKTV